MLEIDLSTKTVHRESRLEKYKKISLGLRWLFLGLFVVQTVYLVSRFTYGNYKMRSLEAKVAILKKQMADRSDDIRNYFRIKESLGAIQRLEGTRFRYRDYLDFIGSLIPPGGSLVDADFAGKNVIIFSIRFVDLASYQIFETTVGEKINSDESIRLGGLTQDVFSRAQDGSYVVKLIMSIKNG